jgi:hypothetical protein
MPGQTEDNHMNTYKKSHFIAAGAIALTLGCADMPGRPDQQGAVLGGAAGAAAGAAVAGSNHRLLGALIGGALGAGGGYLIGSNRGYLGGSSDDKRAAQNAINRAASNPATVADVSRSNTADLNNDGFVTTDEVIAMSQAGLSDNEILDRLRATGHVFELTEVERGFLLDQGVSRNVVNRMELLNA